MKRATPKQYKLLQKFCRDLFKDADYINERKLNYEIQNQISAFSTRYKNYLLQMQLLSVKNKLYFPGPLLRYFKAQDFFEINKLLKLGNVKIIDQEIHFHSIESSPTIEIPTNWEIVADSNYKKIFKIK